MSGLTDRLEALPTMSPPKLRSEWRQLFRAPPPSVGSTLLALGIAYRLQEKVTGGLPPAHVRELVRLAKQAAKGTLSTEPAATLKVGSRLVRDWQGEPHQVLIRDDGFVYRDKLYRSLTPIAREITGSNWSGPRFFGLRGTRAAGQPSG
jgi:hypothetical protein